MEAAEESAGQPDELLLAGFGAGDSGFAAVFLRRFRRIVYGVAFAATGDPASAGLVAQLGFEQAWRSASAYDSHGPVRA